ncbi:MAG: DNA primase family protein [Fusobacteriaceae bacterium]
MIKEINKLEKLGFLKTDKDKLIFNEGVCSRGILEKHKLIVNENDFYIYQSDYWQKLKDSEIKKLCKKEFDTVDINIWRLTYEKRYLPTLKIDSPQIQLKDLNKYPFKMNFENGAYNFKTLTLEPHDEKNLFTYKKKCAIYEEIEDTPLFDELIKVASNNRPELAEYILEFMAYILSGNKTEQRFFVLKGSGQNGKSTLINILTKLIGVDFTTTISISKLGDRFAISAAVGKKLIVASENEGAKNNPIPTEILKMISSGGELVKVEFKNKDPYSDILQLELVFAVNNAISFSETSVGLQRRLTVIPFDGVIKNIDPTFEERLEKEIPEIMRKLIEVYDSIAKRGFKLKNCEIVNKASKGLIVEDEKEKIGEGLYDFFEENLEINPGYRESKSSIFEYYKRTGGHYNVTKFWLDFREFCKFKGRKYEEVRNDKRCVVGFKLSADFCNHFEESEDSDLDIFIE